MLIYKVNLNLIISLWLCHLEVWNKFEESGKKSESFTKIIHGPKETFTNFIHRVISAVNRIVSDSEVRKILIESLAFENSSSECKTVIGPLNTRPAPIEEWVRDMAGI